MITGNESDGGGNGDGDDDDDDENRSRAFQQVFRLSGPADG